MYSNIIQENNIEYSDILDILEEGLEVYTFIEEEYLSLCHEQGLEELSYFEKNRKEMSIQESNESMANKIKAFIEKWVQKIKDWFNSLINHFKKTDKKVEEKIERIKRYNSKNKLIFVDKLKYNGYKFTLYHDKYILSSINRGDAYLRKYEVKSSEQLTSGVEYSYNDIYTELINEMLNNRIKYNSGDNLNDILFRFYRDDKKEKTVLSVDSFSTIETELKMSKDLISDFDEIKKDLNANCSYLVEFASKFDKTRNATYAGKAYMQATSQFYYHYTKAAWSCYNQNLMLLNRFHQKIQEENKIN